MKFLIALLLFTSIGFPQTKNKDLQLNTASGVKVETNLIRNPSGRFRTDLYRTTSNVTVGSGATVYENFGSWSIQATATGGYIEFEMLSPSDEMKSGTCVFNGSYNGTAANYKAQILDGSAVELRSFQFSDVTASTDFEVSYPCGASRKVRLAYTGTGTGLAFDTGRLYYGRGQGVVNARVSTNEISYAATISNLGTSPTQSLKYSLEGSNLFIRGNVVCGSAPPGSIATISLPSGYTTASNISTIEKAGTFGHGNTATVSHGGFVLIEASSTNMFFSSAAAFGDASIDALAKTNGSSVCLAGATLSINAKIPIAGYSNLNAIPATLANTYRTVYTPTFTNFGSVTVHECWQWLEGEFGYVDCKFTAGTTVNAEARVSIPWTSATWANGIRSAAHTGSLSVANSMVIPLIESGVSYVTFGFQGTSNAGLTKVNGQAVMNSGQTLHFVAKIPLPNRSPNNSAFVGPGLVITEGTTSNWRKVEGTFTNNGTVCAVGLSSTGVASITRNGTGRCDMVLTTPFPNVAPYMRCGCWYPQFAPGNQPVLCFAEPTSANTVTFKVTQGTGQTDSGSVPVSFDCGGPR